MSGNLDRLAILVHRPGLVDFVPATVDAHVSAAVKFVEWLGHIPSARIGLKALGIAEIARSCYGERVPLPGIEHVLRRTGSTARVSYDWTADRRIFGPILRLHLRWLTGCKDSDDMVWLNTAEAQRWLGHVKESLLTYGDLALGGPTPQRVDAFCHMAERHDCTVFGQVDLPSLYDRVKELCQHESAGEPWDLVEKAWDHRPPPSSYDVYWSVRPLVYGRSLGNLVHLPTLALMTFWPPDTRWAPIPPVRLSPSPSSTAEIAGERLRSDLWNKIETLFVAARMACGLPPSEPLVSGRKCTPPVVFYADSQPRPSSIADLEAAHSGDLETIARTCLGAEDVASKRVSWATHRHDVVLLRVESIGDKHFTPTYLALPTGRLNRDVAFDAVVIVAWHLAFLEFTIAHESWSCWRDIELSRGQWRRWSAAIEPLRVLSSGALGFSDQLSQHDLRRLQTSAASLSSGFFVMRGAFERLKSDGHSLEQVFARYRDSSEDYVRTEIQADPIVGHFTISDALLDSYPYHFLHQPIGELAATGPSSLLEIESFRQVIDEADRRQRYRNESYNRWLATFLGAAAVVFALPQLIPAVALDSSETSIQLLRSLFRFPIASVTLKFEDVVAAGRILIAISVLATFAIVIRAGFSWLGSQWARRHRVSQLIREFRVLVDTSLAVQALDAPVPGGYERLDAIDSQACAALSQLRDELAHSPQEWPFHGLVDQFTRVFRVRNANLRAWIRFVPQVVAGLLIFPFEWSAPPPLPRLACVLRYGLGATSALNGLAMSDQEFRLALTRAGFDRESGQALVRWLETPANLRAVPALDPSGLSDLLFNRGLRAAAARPDLWHGTLAYRLGRNIT